MPTAEIFTYIDCTVWLPSNKSLMGTPTCISFYLKTGTTFCHRCAYIALAWFLWVVNMRNSKLTCLDGKLATNEGRSGITCSVFAFAMKTGD